MESRGKPWKASIEVSGSMSFDYGKAAAAAAAAATRQPFDL